MSGVILHIWLVKCTDQLIFVLFQCHFLSLSDYEYLLNFCHFFFCHINEKRTFVFRYNHRKSLPQKDFKNTYMV